jgi:hypothetical protein
MSVKNPNFSPIGVKVSGEANLAIGYAAQSDLISRISHTDADLRNNTGAKPAQTELSLRGVELPTTEADTWDQRSFASLDLSEGKSGQGAATLSFTTNKSRDSEVYTLSPIIDCWEEHRHDNPTTVNSLTNYGFMELLASRLDNPRLFEQLFDRVDISGIEIAHILYSHLKGQARTRTKRTVYEANRPIVGHDYFSGAEIALDTHEANSRLHHCLSVVAAQSLGNAMVEKKYTYQAVRTPSSFTSASGLVAMSSSDGIPKSKLEKYATTDQGRNDPAGSLVLAIDTLRAEHGLREL